MQQSKEHIFIFFSSFLRDDFVCAGSIMSANGAKLSCWRWPHFLGGRWLHKALLVHFVPYQRVERCLV